MNDYQAELAFAEALARQAGDIARRHYDPAIVFNPKADNSPVTQADIEINRLVIDRCGAQYPDVGVLGEEESSPGGSHMLWVCDPIDGTIAYMLGVRASTFCLALVNDGVPVVGVVYDFWNNRLYSAIKGGQALLNGVPIVAPAGPPLKLYNFEMFLHAPYRLDGLLQALFEQQWNTSNYLSSAFMSMAVATGRITGVVSAGNKPWDYAAVKVIVEAAGGAVTSLDGTEQRYDGMITGAIVTGATYADELRDLTVEYYRKNLHLTDSAAT